jgi:uncharacterized membrane protein YgaE (UPF0421/DUF939 family)
MMHARRGRQSCRAACHFWSGRFGPEPAQTWVMRPLKRIMNAHPTGMAGPSSAASWLAARSGADWARLRLALWPITQTSVAAGTAFYLAHFLPSHVRPFFAPIAAAIAMGTSRTSREQRAVQLLAGVSLGILLGLGIEALLGTSAVALGVAVFLALCLALVIGHGFLAQGALFSNQTAVAAILVIALHRSATGPNRLIDALIGGGTALVFILVLFPPYPVPVIRSAMQSVLTVSSQELRQLHEFMTGAGTIEPDWLLTATERIGTALAELGRARATARRIVRFAPLRRSSKAAVAAADQLAQQLAATAAAVLTLGSLTIASIDAGEHLPSGLQESTGQLSAALSAVADAGGTVAADAVEAATQAVRGARSVQPGTALHVPIIASVAASCGHQLLQAAQLLPPRTTGQASRPTAQ